MKHKLLNIMLLLVLIAGAVAVGYGLPREPQVVTMTKVITDTIEKKVFVPYPEIIVKETERIVEVPIHNEPGLHEFTSKRELQAYVSWYRNNKMIQYGVDQCEDYAYDFMQQAIADGYLVSTEAVEKSKEVWHLANTAPIGNEVWLVDIAPGNIELYALKD